MGNEERREHKRVPLQGTVTVSSGTGELRGSITNVSIGGIGVVGPRAADPGEFVRIRFTIPTSGGDKVLNPDAVVIRAVPVGSEYAWALQFMSLDAASEGAIAAYVENAGEPSGAKRAPVMATSAAGADERLRSGSTNVRRGAVAELLRLKKEGAKAKEPEDEASKPPEAAPAKPATPAPAADDGPARSKRDLLGMFRQALLDKQDPKKKP